MLSNFLIIVKYMQKQYCFRIFTIIIEKNYFAISIDKARKRCHKINIKSGVAIVLVFVMLVMCMGAGYSGKQFKYSQNAELTTENEFNTDDYYHLTFHATAKTSEGVSDYSVISNSIVQTNQEIIDDAIEYVHSLELEESGLGYLEEECIFELERYKEQDVSLESYTVLVPKEITYNYYGSYGGNDYYYYYISEAKFDKITIGVEKSAANEMDWGKWTMGLINVGMNYADTFISVPFSLITSALGIVDNSEILYGAHNLYYQKFTNIRTKIIYRGSSTIAGEVKYRGQSGIVEFTSYFCPLDTGEPAMYITKEASENVDLNNEFSQSYLLSYFQYTNTTGEIMDLNLISFSAVESWK